MAFITFEGLEGSGKSTQSKLLFEALKEANFDVILTREPGGTEAAEKIREFIIDEALDIAPMTQLLLHNAARYEHVTNVILPALKAKKIVICDRFVDSTIAYQGFGQKLGMKIPALIHNVIMEGIAPDLTIIFDIDEKIGLERAKKRSGSDRYHNMNEEFFSKVRHGFLKISQMARDRCVTIDANASIERIHNLILKLVRERLNIDINANV